MRLQTVANQFITKAYHRERSFVDVRATVPHKSYEVIRLYAEWEHFCHKLFVASVVRRPQYSDGGFAIPLPSYTGGYKLAEDLKARTNGRPIYWGTSSVFARWCNVIGPANKNVLIDAMTSSTSRAESLRDVRNFLAHRNDSTRTRVTGTYSFVDTHDLIGWLSAPALGGRSNLGLWVESLVDVASASTKRP